MAEPVIYEDAEGVVTLTPAVAIRPGQILGVSGTTYVLSDADQATYIGGQYVALGSASANDAGNYNPIQACKKVVFYDEDAPYTHGATQYLSATAGEISTTRPATDGDLVQIVGRAIDTKRVLIELKSPVEFEQVIDVGTYDTSGETGLGTTDAGWSGPQIDASGETSFFKGRFPEALFGAVKLAQLIANSINASAMDIDITVVGAYDGAANNQDTAVAITAGDMDQADADNIILTMAVSTVFDSGFYTPARNWSLLVDPDGVTGDFMAMLLHIRGDRFP